MSSLNERIKPLPFDVVTKVKSSASITELGGVIIELVKNSLDANAHNINITVDFQRGSCAVEDDGNGISPSEFEPSGGLGKPHYTSRFQAGEDKYGRRGLFLSSLACLSLLMITSHHIQHNSTNTLLFHRSEAISRLTPAPIQQRLKLSRHGTRVTVNNLFGDIPVRVKNRALSLQRPGELEREWEHLRHVLVALTLANDKLRRLVLNDVKGNKKFTVRALQAPVNLDSSQGAELDVRRIHSIFAQADLVNNQNIRYWSAISAGTSNISIHAVISRTPCPTKKAQFISFGVEPLYPLDDTNFLYKEINRLFAYSDFGTVGAVPAHQINEFASLNEDNAAAKGPTKAISRWPMFYIRINTDAIQDSYSSDGIMRESDRPIKHVMDLLSAIVNGFLEQHDLRPRGAKRQRDISQDRENPRADGRKDIKRTKCMPALERLVPVSSTEEAFDGRLKLPSFQISAAGSGHGTWSNARGVIGVSANSKSAHSEAKKPGSTAREDLPRWPGSDLRGPPRCRPLDQRILLPSGLSSDATQYGMLADSLRDEMVRWVDPTTGRTYLINSRTGQSINLQAQEFLHNRPRSAGFTQLLQPDRTRPATAMTSGPQSKWVGNLLERWDNPAFCRPERPIASINVEASHGHGKPNSPRGAGSSAFWMAGLRLGRKLKREHLMMAEIIAQVDRKFVLVRMRATSAHTREQSPSTILVLIDQHAADERCRVEQLFQDLFISSEELYLVDTKDLLNPIVFEVLPTEVPQFKRNLEFFSAWGIQYSIAHKPGSGEPGRISVNTLPALIAERCRSEPSLIIDLIRAEIRGREECGGLPATRRKPDSSVGPDFDGPGCEASWMERLSGCPQGVIELLNSRACRSAIMFNDVLTLGECQSLVSRLARCILPFQCAHGRPSMVPILDLQLDGPFVLSHPKVDFISTFRSWRGGLSNQ